MFAGPVVLSTFLVVPLDAPQQPIPHRLVSSDMLNVDEVLTCTYKQMYSGDACIRIVQSVADSEVRYQSEFVPNIDFS